MQFDAFHGGSDARFSPTEDRYIYFDDIKITEGTCVAGAVVNDQDIQPTTAALVEEDEYESTEYGEDPLHDRDERDARDDRDAEQTVTETATPVCSSADATGTCTEVAQPPSSPVEICSLGTESCTDGPTPAGSGELNDGTLEPEEVEDEDAYGPELAPEDEDDALMASSSIKTATVASSAVLCALMFL